jgi:tetratricopeptide (TPR) repeat protein
MQDKEVLNSEEAAAFLVTIALIIAVGVLLLTLSGCASVEAPGAPAPGARPQESWGDRAVALEKARDWPGVLALCRRWTQAEPGNEDAWNSLGLAYGCLDRHQDAIAAYREAVRLKPDFAEAWNNLAIAYDLSGNRSAALEAVKELRRYDPQQADKLFNLIMKP